MVEILPNWHPIFVHFSVALFFVAAISFFVSHIPSEYAARYQARQYARITLWLAASFSVFTVAAGMYAYYTVNHDGPSHEWMTIHRNVALGTFVIIAVLAIWSLVCAKRQIDENKGFLFLIVLGLGALLSTSWLGGELVYRYGLGVQSLPSVTGEGHDHDHGDGGHDHQSANGNSHENLMDDSSLNQNKSESHVHKDNKPHKH